MFKINLFKFKCMAVSIFVFFTPLTHAFAENVMDFGFVEFEPYFYTNEKGESSGFILDKIIKISKAAGWNLNTKGYPMKRLAQLTKEGHVDMTVLLKVVFDENEVEFSERKITDITLRSYTIGNHPAIKYKEDLSGKSIGIFRGFTYGGWIDYIKNKDNHVKYYEVSTHLQLFNLLKYGRVDYVLDYKYPSNVALQKLDIPGLTYSDVKVMPIYFIVSNNNKRKNSKEIVREINAAYDSLIKMGQVTE